MEKITLNEFDTILKNYIYVMGIKNLTLKIFYKNFKLAYYGAYSDYWKTYQYFKQNSRHLKQLQLEV
jgi:hypothetical protein